MRSTCFTISLLVTLLPNFMLFESDILSAIRSITPENTVSLIFIEAYSTLTVYHLKIIFLFITYRKSQKSKEMFLVSFCFFTIMCCKFAILAGLRFNHGIQRNMNFLVFSFEYTHYQSINFVYNYGTTQVLIIPFLNLLLLLVVP
jgi:hypothetical protein